MTCKYLVGSRIPGCLGADQPMHPSIYELKVFCQKDHKNCLVYQNREALISAAVPAEISSAATPLVARSSVDDAVSF